MNCTCLSAIEIATDIAFGCALTAIPLLAVAAVCWLVARFGRRHHSAERRREASETHDFVHRDRVGSSKFMAIKKSEETEQIFVAAILTAHS